MRSVKVSNGYELYYDPSVMTHVSAGWGCTTLFSQMVTVSKWQKNIKMAEEYSRRQGSLLRKTHGATVLKRFSPLFGPSFCVTYQMSSSAFFSALLMRPSFGELLNIVQQVNNQKVHKHRHTKKYVGNKPQWTWWRKRPRGCKPGWGSGWSWPPSWRQTSPTPTGSTERKWLNNGLFLQRKTLDWFFGQNSKIFYPLTCGIISKYWSM